MKLRIIVLMLCGVAGVGASFAFAAGGSHAQNAFCRHTVLFGTVSAPQAFTVTVSRSWRHSSLTRGQTVNVAVGSSGQTIRFGGEGCVGSDGTVTLRQGVLQVVRSHDGDGGQTTTTTDGGTTTSGGDQPPTTTNGDHPPTTTNGDHPGTTTNSNDPPPTTSTNNTTTSTIPHD